MMSPVPPGAKGTTIRSGRISAGARAERRGADQSPR